MPVGNLFIKSFHILGNEISTLVDEYKPAGKYELSLMRLVIPVMESVIYQVEFISINSRAGEFYRN